MTPAHLHAFSPLQAFAEEWIAADDAMAEANQKVVQAQDEYSTLVRRKQEAGAQLVEGIGVMCPTRVYQVGAEVVIVERERGIRRVKVEDPKL